MSGQLKTPNVPVNPESQAFINTMISRSVSEAVSSIFANLSPMMKEMALTPEKIKALQTKLPTPAEVAREERDKRETRKSKEDEAQLRRETARRQANCPHRYPNNTDSINLVHNYPDRQVRGICSLCHDLIEPRHWVILAPDKDGKENAKIVDAHKDYARVINIENTRA